MIYWDIHGIYPVVRTVSYWSHGQVGNSWFTLGSMVDLSSSLCQRVPEGNSWFYSAFSGITLVTTQLLWSALKVEKYSRDKPLLQVILRDLLQPQALSQRKGQLSGTKSLMGNTHLHWWCAVICRTQYAICQTVDHSLFAQPIPTIPSMSETSQMNILHLTGWKV